MEKGMQMDSDALYFIPQRQPDESEEEWLRRCAKLNTTRGDWSSPAVPEKYAIYKRSTTAVPPTSRRPYLEGRTAIEQLPWGMDNGLEWLVWLRRYAAIHRNDDGNYWYTLYIGSADTWEGAAYLAQSHYQFGFPKGWRVQGDIDILDCIHETYRVRRPEPPGVVLGNGEWEIG